MLLPLIVAVLYGDPEWFDFAIVSGGLIILGWLGTISKPKNNTIYLKEGCVATSLSWIIMSLFGCLPFYMSGAIPKFTDALFDDGCEHSF